MSAKSKEGREFVRKFWDPVVYDFADVEKKIIDFCLAAEIFDVKK
jgi:hypothetical protein